MDTSIHYTCLTEAELATIDGGASVLTRQIHRSNMEYFIQFWT